MFPGTSKKHGVVFCGEVVGRGGSGNGRDGGGGRPVEENTCWGA